MLIAFHQQLRAARGLLAWSQSELAERAGITQQSVANIENQKQVPQQSTTDIIVQTFEQAGVLFTENGVRLADGFQTVLEGAESYLRLLDDVFYTLKDTGQEFVVFNCDDRKSSPDVVQSLKRIRASKVRMRALVAEGNDYLIGPLKEYRAVPKQYFGNNVTVVYGDKVALASRDQENFLRIVVINAKIVAGDYYRLFNLIWDFGAEVTKTSATISYDI